MFYKINNKIQTFLKQFLFESTVLQDETGNDHSIGTPVSKFFLSTPSLLASIYCRYKSKENTSFDGNVFIHTAVSIYAWLPTSCHCWAELCTKKTWERSLMNIHAFPSFLHIFQGSVFASAVHLSFTLWKFERGRNKNIKGIRSEQSDKRNIIYMDIHIR